MEEHAGLRRDNSTPTDTRKEDEKDSLQTRRNVGVQRCIAMCTGNVREACQPADSALRDFSSASFLLYLVSLQRDNSVPLSRAHHFCAKYFKDRFDCENHFTENLSYSRLFIREKSFLSFHFALSCSDM